MILSNVQKKKTRQNNITNYFLKGPTVPQTTAEYNECNRNVLPFVSKTKTVLL